MEMKKNYFLKIISYKKQIATRWPQDAQVSSYCCHLLRASPRLVFVFFPLRKRVEPHGILENALTTHTLRFEKLFKLISS